MQDLINPALATVAAELFTLPICTVKTNYQNSKSPTIRHTVKTLYGQGGIKNFFQASIPAIASQMLSTSSKYFLYRQFEQKNNPEHIWWIRTLNGSVSGLISSLVTHPMDTVKVHWQMGQDAPPLCRTNYYRGYSKTLSKYCIGSALFFPLYDGFINSNVPPTLASFFTAVIATTVLQPIDYAKTRQIYGLEHLNKDSILRSYFRGVTLSYARVVPHFIITMSVIKALESK